MGAARSAASIVRHAGGALTEAILIAAIVGLIALALSPAYGPARFLTGSDRAAAAAAPTGTIALAGSAARVSTLRYGSSVAFDTTVKGRLAPKSTVYVTVVCKQGSTVVYQWSGAPSFTFPLEQQVGLKALGYVWDPAQDAECSGTLVYRDDGGRTPKIIFLDKVPFGTVGS